MLAAEPVAIRAGVEWLVAVERHAMEVYPQECCGVIVAERGRRAALKCGNAAADRRRGQFGFELDPGDLARILGGLDGDGRLLAFYHSHPNGLARMSPADRRAATAAHGPWWPGVAQLIVAVSALGQVDRRLFQWSGSLAQWIEADPVTLDVAVDRSPPGS